MAKKVLLVMLELGILLVTLALAYDVAHTIVALLERLCFWFLILGILFNLRFTVCRKEKSLFLRPFRPVCQQPDEGIERLLVKAEEEDTGEEQDGVICSSNVTPTIESQRNPQPPKTIPLRSDKCIPETVFRALPPSTSILHPAKHQASIVPGG
ncbi:hypothetical protein P389DRAFT_179449 [Cystobasidium minutum MCA 4210]|uniref:uncharacterized protein n=1 Tax=Cystobasidium minutum MCA 4210 TaxID=1397322 RepID=UPI0034D01786|eukprot:jgi/Rhomi1/179449/fgenesh1_pg.3_\